MYRWVGHSEQYYVPMLEDTTEGRERGFLFKFLERARH